MRADLEQALIKHISFKSKLRALLYGSEVDEAPLQSEKVCSLGVWIEQTGRQQYAHLPQMRELERLHTQMHDIARKLIRLYRKGQEEEARAGLPEVEAAGDRLLVLLDSLDKDA